MGKKFLIDTNILIYHFNDALVGEGRSFVMSILKMETKISVITKIELLSWQTLDVNAFTQIQTFVENCTVYPRRNVQKITC